MLVYDVTDLESFCDVDLWFDEIIDNVSRDVLHL